MAPVKERVAKHRMKIQDDPVSREAYLEKERLRSRNRRSRDQEILSDGSKKASKLRTLKRENNRLRQQKRRMKIKEAINNSPNDLLSLPSSYKSVQSLGKAKNRVRKTLPNSPRKRLEVATEIFKEVVPSAVHILKKVISPRTSRQLDDDTRVKVIEFYELDSISRQEPGKRGVVSVKNIETRQRTLVQKRIMLMAIKEAYFLFIEENPNARIKMSKFFELRPKHILPFANMPHNVCVCKYHANMDFLIKSLHDKVPSFPNDGKQLIDALVCNSKVEACMNEICYDCKDNIKCMQTFIEDVDPLTEVTWKEWSDSDGRPQVLSKNGTIMNLLQKIEKQFTYYKWHVYVKRIQATSFEESKTAIETGVAVLQVDFAENYSTTAQDEIQSAHWSHGQVTIFTAVAWLADGIKRCFAVVSNDLVHGKVSVFAFMKRIVKELKDEFPELVHLKIYSDGCAAQFKNKFTLSNIIHMKEDFNGVTGEWSFFASSHGKGAVDGVGGTLKRNVWLKIKTRQVTINSAEAFATCAKDTVKNINVLYVSAEEVAGNEGMLMSRWEDVQPIPKLQTVHHVQKTSHCNNTLCVRMTNVSDTKTLVGTHQNVATSEEDDDGITEIYWNTNDDRPTSSATTSSGFISAGITTVDSTLGIVPGSFVRVGLPISGKAIKTRYYYAEVADIDRINDSITLSYMAPSGKNLWVWPEVKEESWESISLVSLEQVAPPTLINNRGQLQFNV